MAALADSASAGAMASPPPIDEQPPRTKIRAPSRMSFFIIPPPNRVFLANSYSFWVNNLGSYLITLLGAISRHEIKPVVYPPRVQPI
jgi:hypothetical protein